MSLSKQVSFYDQSPDVALEFFRIMNPKERADTTKSTLQEVKLTADSSVLGEVPEHTTPIAITVPQGPEEQTPAQIIAQRLRELGDQLDQQLSLDFREKFEAEFKNQSVFSLGYDNFSRLCISSLASVQDRVRTGWDQVYLLYYGYSEVAKEIFRQAGDAAEDRLRRMANYLRDIMRETSLEEWVERQGGLTSFDPANSVISGDRVVQIYVPPEGSSVD